MGSGFFCTSSLSWCRIEENQEIQPVCTRGLANLFCLLADMRSREEVVRKMRCRGNGEGDKLRYRLARQGKFVGIGFMICWFDRELAVRSLETAAIRSLRPEILTMSKGIVRSKIWVAVGRSGPARPWPLAYNQGRSRPHRGMLHSQPVNWVWLSDLQTLYAFEQQRVNTLIAHLSFCLRSYVVDWQTQNDKFQSLRAQLRCAQLLSFVQPAPWEQRRSPTN